MVEKMRNYLRGSRIKIKKPVWGRYEHFKNKTDDVEKQLLCERR